MSYWDRPSPYIVNIRVAENAIDRMNHVNNATYLNWLEKAAWGHTAALNLDWDVHLRLNRSFVAHRTELDYLAAAFLNDELEVATWITANDGRLTLERAYQIYRPSDESTIMRATTRWVCVDIDTGKPKRMPREFVEGYVVAKETE